MLAWKLLQRIEKSQAFADVLLEKTFSQRKSLRPLDRAYITELVLGSLRWQGRLDWVIQRYSHQTPERKVEPRLLNLLRLGAYQIQFLDRVPVAAAVDESVRLAKAVFKNPKIAGYVNAVLRSIARHKGSEDFPRFTEQPGEYLTHALAHPRWMVEDWIRNFGPEIARQISLANNHPPPFTVRVNTLRASRESLQAQFQTLGIPSQPTPFSPEGLILGKNPFLVDKALFSRGLYFVQDEASQMVAHLLTPQPGDRILDACSAPGGKSTHLAQLMKNQGLILAADLYRQRIHLVRENCQRLGLSIVKPVNADVTRNLPFAGSFLYDRILVDAPCTGLGILHRNPETKWRRQPADARNLQRVQLDILKNVCWRLKPDGVLVYSTCTLTREENDEVVEIFLNSQKNFRLQNLKSFLPEAWHPLIDEKGFFRTYPQAVPLREGYRLDGFFAARMIRKNEQGCINFAV